MSNDTSMLPTNWVESDNGRRPMLPSEQRTCGTATQRKLPGARAIPGEDRPLYPWSHGATNDWRNQLSAGAASRDA